MSAPEPKEFKIERDYDDRMAFARSMYHMAVQAAEAELETALARAASLREAELSAARRTALGADLEA